MLGGSKYHLSYRVLYDEMHECGALDGGWIGTCIAIGTLVSSVTAIRGHIAMDGWLRAGGLAG